MRTRHKKLSHYGLSEARGEELLQLAKLEENRKVIREAAERSNSFLAPYLMENLVRGAGYNAIFKGQLFPAAIKGDFYAYRRKSLATFNLLLSEREYRKWSKKDTEVALCETK